MSRPIQEKRAERHIDTTRSSKATHCNTLQHTATHCNILQHTEGIRVTQKETRDRFDDAMRYILDATHCNNLYYAGIC